MRSILQFILLITIILMVSVVPVHGQETIKLRVAISSNGSHTGDFKVVNGNYTVKDLATNIIIANLKSGDEISLQQAGINISVIFNGNTKTYTGPILALPENEAGLNVFSFGNTQYRDAFSVEVNNSSLLVVNGIDIERYLYGVVGKEIGYSVPGEALKAQAVVSRSFAMASRGSSLKYDFGSDTSAQVYGGYSAEKNLGGEKVKEAVDATSGKIIYYKINNTKKVVKAFFHSNAGGYTENSENVWSEALPYFRATPSPEDKYAEEYSLKTGQSYPGSTFKWEKSFKYEQIVQAIQQYQKKLASPINIGDFVELRLHRVNKDGTQTASGRVTKMEVIGTQGTFSVFGDSIRRVFDLKSTKFKVIPSDDYCFFIKDGSGVKQKVKEISSLMGIQGDKTILSIGGTSTSYKIIDQEGIKDYTKGNISLTFTGYGNGHGLGMSQWGAIGMAEKGYTFKEIIEHYYNQDNCDGKLSIENLTSI